MDRISLLKNQISSQPDPVETLENYRKHPTINQDEFASIVYGPYTEFRAFIQQKMASDPLFKPLIQMEINREEYRSVTFK